MRLPLLALLVLAFGSSHAQPTPCHSTPVGYDGPCYYGALPAFFDDFAYASARTTGSIEHAPTGDLFGLNAWTMPDGTVQSRGWHRFNRSSLPIPGTITFEEPSVMKMGLPAGFEAEDYDRSQVVFSPRAMRAGTYLWRVRLSEHRGGHELRQAVWTMSPTSYILESDQSGQPVRRRFWSELDFENESHPRVRGRDGAPDRDFVSRMSVTNHFGVHYEPSGAQRMDEAGPAPKGTGDGFLARNGPPTQAFMETAPVVGSWAERWLYLVMHVDGEAQTVTYRMMPESRDRSLRSVAERSVTTGPSFYPQAPMHLAFSLHWLKPRHRDRHPRLRASHSLEVDWAYYTPAGELDVGDVLAQVALLRRADLTRVNTTGRPTIEVYDYPDSIPLRITGPDRVQCGEAVDWTVEVHRIGTYFTSYRYRYLDRTGAAGPWRESVDRTLTVTPHRKQTGLELEATAQDFWEPHGIVQGEHWRYPNRDNLTTRAHRTVAFDCTER
ncbi:MAG: hypothetical protein AAGI91_01585 [Bacteroidota bacterium]